MFLSTIECIQDDEHDYVLLIDYGSEGLKVLSRHEYLAGAIKAKFECNYGSSMAIVKVCRIADPVEI